MKALSKEIHSKLTIWDFLLMFNTNCSHITNRVQAHSEGGGSTPPQPPADVYMLGVVVVAVNSLTFKLKYN